MKRRLSQGKGCLHYEQRELCSRFEYSVQPRVGVEQPEGSDPREYANLNVVELLEEGGNFENKANFFDRVVRSGPSSWF